ncbi:MAG: PadR family transcriptional regulator [Ruminococcaceae bacterium]|nr:PadR family transcriptional regulator [Oscillospiraceae bacterium]
MPREKFHTLTEQMFYVLLCLKNECYGMDILDRVPAMTDERVNVGSGTLYNLLEQFLEAGVIRETKVEGRRRSYILTEKGREMLEKEYQRIWAQAADYRSIFGEGKGK